MSNLCQIHEQAQSGLGVLWKTVSEACNLACDYCYYSTCKGQPNQIKRISDEVLERFMKDYLELSNGMASIAWQGGEPLLAGFDFFKKVIEFEIKWARPNTVISNSLQTNGTLINEEWADFFKKYNFLIGVSLDGPEEINDARRVTGSGRGSFKRVMKGIQYLKDKKVDFNILTVLHEGNITKAKKLFEFYRQEELQFIQFIPCMDFKAQDITQPGQFLITPQQYGDFMCDAFDEWYNEGYPEMSIRFFDDLLAQYLHQESGLCVHRSTCPKTVIFEQNGDAYPCDFFIHEDYFLGNIDEVSLSDILDHSNYEDFLRKKPSLPEQCVTCEYLNLCHGGCPRNRNWDPQEVMRTDYFCESYRQIYEYTGPRMEIVAQNIKRRQLQEYIQSGFKLPGRNEPCLCGSGKKFKKCCEGLI